LTHRELPSIINPDEGSMGATTGNRVPSTNNLDPLRSNELLYKAACNPAYIGILERYVSFATWPPSNLSSVDELVRAGVFYTGTNIIVTCFYCNGSLQN
jgi:hypothetical protein